MHCLPVGGILKRKKKFFLKFTELSSFKIILIHKNSAKLIYWERTVFFFNEKDMQQLCSQLGICNNKMEIKIINKKKNDEDAIGTK